MDDARREVAAAAVHVVEAIEEEVMHKQIRWVTVGSRAAGHRLDSQQQCAGSAVAGKVDAQQAGGAVCAVTDAELLWSGKSLC